MKEALTLVQELIRDGGGAGPISIILKTVQLDVVMEFENRHTVELHGVEGGRLWASPAARLSSADSRERTEPARSPRHPRSLAGSRERLNRYPEVRE